MKRTGSGEGYSVMKKGHEEKVMDKTMCADLRYSKYGDDVAKEQKEAVDGLANYVRKNKEMR